MRTLSMLLLSVLTSCTSLPVALTATASSEPLPSLSYPNIEGGKAMRAPAAISHLLLSLPMHEVLASAQLRQRYLEGDVLAKEIGGLADSPAYLVMDGNGSQYRFWIRSFKGTRKKLTGYLIEVRGSCAGLKGTDPAYATPVAEAKRQCAVNGARHFDSGLRAYRVFEGHPPEDITASIAPDPAVSSKAMLEHYASLGASHLFAIDDNLSRLPVFRWVMEFDPEQTSASSDPPIFGGGHFVHAGFVVWTGEQFVRKTTVPRALWPCRVSRPQECPPKLPDEDQFVID